MNTAKPKHPVDAELIDLLEDAISFSQMNYPEDLPEFYPWQKRCREVIEILKTGNEVRDE